MIERKRRLKNWVVVSAFSLMLICIIGVSFFISNLVFSSLEGDNYSYVLRDLVTNSLPVVSEVDNKIIKPYVDESVNTHIDFYDLNDKAEEQERSLILYEKTYMPNSGILYGSDKSFEVVAIAQGVVSSITEDEVFGTILEIKHTNNLISKYSSLSKVNVNVGDSVGKGEVIGESGTNKVVSVSQNMLLFELMYNGTNVNPEKYYDVNIDELGQ